jgi:hypothetical protein
MEKKMNKKWLPHIIAAGSLAAFIVLGLASGTTDAATKRITFNSIEESKEYLASQEENKLDNPIRIAVPADDSTLKDVLDAIKSAGKYVGLELSGNALTTIPPNAFKDNTFITNITLPDSVISIQDNAFSGCPNLTGLLLGSKVASISYSAFNNCPKLIWINVNDRNQNYSSLFVEKEDRLLGNKEEGGNYRLLCNKDGTIIRCPEGCKGHLTLHRDIGPYAFSGSNITSVAFRGGGLDLSTGKLVIQRVYENAFVNCTNLTSVIFFTGTTTEISKGSFDGDLFELWDKATMLKHPDGRLGRDVGFEGTFTRTNGTSTKWTMKVK